MIERKIYLQKLIDFKDANLIKVVTGIRRCGKSTMFELFQNYLKDNGVSDEQITVINFEDLAFEELLNYKVLYKYKSGQSTKVTVNRSGKEVTVDIKF